MSQEETPKPSVPDDGPPALDAAPQAPAAPDAAPGAPEPTRAPPPLGSDPAGSGGEHSVQPAEAAADASGEAAPNAPAPADQPHRRRRRRRRHRKGPPLNDASGGAPRGEGASVAVAETITGEAVTSEAGASDGPSDGGGAGLHFSESGRPILSLPEAPPPQATPGSPAQPGEHKRRRRRRRRGKRPEGAAPLQASGEAGISGGESTGAEGANLTAPAAEGNVGERPPRARSPRHRRRRDRRDSAGPRMTDGAPREGGNDRAPREGASREDRPRRDRDRRDRGERGDREGGDRERGPRDGKKRFGKKQGFGQGRDDRRPKELPKLYSFESIVDRGFEDVADPANDGATRRVDWQIVKRTVADQKSAKPVSAVYLLRREGTDTDFANLAAARQAVNKTIVHPEKLTRPKADYPSTKK